ncbi:MAG: hypothetical protein ACOYYF_03590 [Chloroflexota bacterium]|nr:hypothetical protein [Chloroflexota bacterium]MBI5703758.1 hypothetical protein [Chloroflexota bacterium]
MNESALIIKIDSPPGRKIYAGRLKIIELWVEPVETRSLPTSVSTST